MSASLTAHLVTEQCTAAPDPSVSSYAPGACQSILTLQLPLSAIDTILVNANAKLKAQEANKPGTAHLYSTACLLDCSTTGKDGKKKKAASANGAQEIPSQVENFISTSGTSFRAAFRMQNKNTVSSATARHCVEWCAWQVVCNLTNKKFTLTPTLAEQFRLEQLASR